MSGVTVENLMAKIQDLPEILGVNAALAEARKTREAQIKDSLDRLLKARAILEQSRSARREDTERPRKMRTRSKGDNDNV